MIEVINNKLVVAGEYMTNWSSIFANQTVTLDLTNLDTSAVTNMHGMFYNSEFNQDISKWDMSRVVDTGDMFWCSTFDKDLSNWDLSGVLHKQTMFNHPNMIVATDCGTLNRTIYRYPTKDLYSVGCFVGTWAELNDIVVKQYGSMDNYAPNIIKPY